MKSLGMELTVDQEKLIEELRKSFKNMDDKVIICGGASTIGVTRRCEDHIRGKVLACSESYPITEDTFDGVGLIDLPIIHAESEKGFMLLRNESTVIADCLSDITSRLEKITEKELICHGIINEDGRTRRDVLKELRQAEKRGNHSLILSLKQELNTFSTGNNSSRKATKKRKKTKKQKKGRK